MGPQAQGLEALGVHNTARAARGLAPLQWDGRLAREAKEYARVLSVKRYLEHAKCDDGENLYQQSCGDCTYAVAVKAWLAEESIYNGENSPNGRFEEYGHYTQCMWSRTTHVGMGWARSLDGMTFIVARYYPGGNVVDERPF